MKKSICVFSSSSDDISPVYFKVAEDLGKRIAENECSLVYGGASFGLMGTVAKSVHKHGGNVIGVIPQLINDKGITYKLADEVIITKDMRERKAVMDERSDIFIALPGGFGTLEEIIEVITLKQLGYHNKPIIFVDVNNYYEKLVSFFQHIYDENFAKLDFRKLYYITDKLDEVFTYINAYSPENLPNKY